MPRTTFPDRNSASSPAFDWPIGLCWLGTRTGTLEQPLSLVTRRVECSLGCLGVGWRSERSQQAVRRVDSPPSPPQWQPTTLPTPKPRKKRDSTHPALVGNRVLARGSKSLVCLDLDSK